MMLIDFLIFSLVGFGFFWFLNYSELTEWLRYYLKYAEEYDHHDQKFPATQRRFLYRLMTCSFCSGYHFAWLLLLFHGYGWKSFIYAFGVAALTYLWNLIEKVLLRKSV